MLKLAESRHAQTVEQFTMAHAQAAEQHKQELFQLQEEQRANSALYKSHIDTTDQLVVQVKQQLANAEKSHVEQRRQGEEAQNTLKEQCRQLQAEIESLARDNAQNKEQMTVMRQENDKLTNMTARILELEKQVQ